MMKMPIKALRIKKKCCFMTRNLKSRFHEFRKERKKTTSVIISEVSVKFFSFLQLV